MNLAKVWKCTGVRELGRGGSVGGDELRIERAVRRTGRTACGSVADWVGVGPPHGVSLADSDVRGVEGKSTDTDIESGGPCLRDEAGCNDAGRNG